MSSSASTHLQNVNNRGSSAITTSGNGSVWVNTDADATAASFSIATNTEITDRLDAIEDKLYILRKNTGLEERWQELEDIRIAYQKLELELIAKEKTFNTLKN